MFLFNELFRKCVNYLWKNILALNKHEYPLGCSTLILVLLLSFRKGGTMNRKDSINDGTFKSFKNIKNFLEFHKGNPN
jgi:hypothetical protein